MSTQRKVIVIVDHKTRLTFSTVAKAKRFADRMMRSHHIAVELT